ncbi:MAG: GAF domain-containing protein, partial [Armatimonadota bacterium]
MLKGIAHAGGDGLPEDRYAIIVALSQLSETLASAEPNVALSAAAETAGALLRVSRALVFTKVAADQLHIAGSFGAPIDPDLAAASHEIAREALATNSPIVVTNAHAQTARQFRKLSDAGVSSVICVPMRVANATVGAIVALSDDLRAFSPADVELLHVVASHAALAAFRADEAEEKTEEADRRRDELIRLADRKIQELSLLNQVSDAMSSTLELDALLKIALEQSLAAARIRHLRLWGSSSKSAEGRFWSRLG